MKERWEMTEKVELQNLGEVSIFTHGVQSLSKKPVFDKEIPTVMSRYRQCFVLFTSFTLLSKSWVKM